MNFRSWAALAAFLIFTGTAVAQQLDSATSNQAPKASQGQTPSGGLFEGTPEEQAACSPDATKFCSEQIPVTMQVLACLQQNRSKLRKVCREVLEAHGQ
jgi:hypothetical protein